MNYEKFKQQLLEELNQKTNEHITSFEQSTSMKNNNNTMDSIVAHFSSKSAIQPVFHPEELFEDYENGQSINSIVNSVVEQSEYTYKHSPNLDRESLVSEAVRCNLYLQLVNEENNQMIKDNCAHLQVNDLIAVARCKVEIDGEQGSYLVNRKIQAEMKLTDDELLSIARENTLAQPFTIKTMAEVLGESLGIELNDSPVSQVYVLSNPDGINGSVHMLNPKATMVAYGIMNNENFYLIPSSVHELLLLPESMVDDPASLSLMCNEVNETVVKNTEVLSNSIYRYDHETQKISICNNLEDLQKLQETNTQTQTHHRRQAM
jgi:hypothetical protein